MVADVSVPSHTEEIAQLPSLNSSFIPQRGTYLSVELTEWYWLTHSLLMVHQPLMEPKLMENGSPKEQEWNGQY